jgi:hypothetical protein
LTRDRRGTENTFLMHADRPGERPRLLYWYRTAPGIVLGRSPLDEDAIRTIEEQHPGIDFDWPAILALSEVMTPEEEAPAPKPQQQRQKRRSESSRESSHEPRREDRKESRAPEPTNAERREEPAPVAFEPAVDVFEEATPVHSETLSTTHGLLEELVGREIATRLRARYSEIMARIHEHGGDAATRSAFVTRAESLNPDTWLTPDAILSGVRGADNLFEKLRADLVAAKSDL